MNSVPPSYISCALCVFWKKGQQNQNLDSVLFAFFRKQHEFKRSHFDIECPLLANGSYKIKIRVLWIVFRHLISVVRCACFEKRHSKTKISILSVLFAFFRKQHEFKRSHFDIECPLLANGSNKIKIRVLWIVFSHLISCALCVFWKKHSKTKISILCCLRYLENSTSLKEAILTCPLLANGSYEIKIRVLWIVFRHLISVVRCACFEKKHSKTKIWSLCCLRFLENSTSFFKKKPFWYRVPSIGQWIL